MTERAHLMCPNMNFAVKIKVKACFETLTFQKALHNLMEAEESKDLLQSAL